MSRFISPPPATIEGFERFIGWAIRQRQAGQYVCFAVVPHGSDTAIGIFQVRSLEPAFGTAEWGFALASEFWGSGDFHRRREADRRLRVRRARRAPAGSARGAEERARQRRAAEARSRAGRRAAPVVPAGTASIWTRRCGRSCRTNGSRPRPSGARVIITDVESRACRGPRKSWTSAISTSIFLPS